jgi:hypothetical protein
MLDDVHEGPFHVQERFSQCGIENRPLFFFSVEHPLSPVGIALPFRMRAQAASAARDLARR